MKNLRKLIQEEVKRQLKLFDDSVVEESVLREIGELSSGTISTLLRDAGVKNSNKYEVIDDYRNRFFEFVEQSKKQYKNWKDAWEDFEISYVQESLKYLDEGLVEEAVENSVRILTEDYGGRFEVINRNIFESTFRNEDIMDRFYNVLRMEYPRNRINIDERDNKIIFYA